MADSGEDQEARCCLLSLHDRQRLHAPLAHSSKIKYTCITASERYVALGANTGGVYCFHRDGLKYIRILANREGSVSQLRFAPGGNVLAAVCGSGHVAFWELNLQEQGVSKRFHVSSQLKDASVRDLVWDARGARLFYGDDQGRIAVAKVSKGSRFKKVDDIIFQSQDKAPIVQLDTNDEKLLISTTTRSLIMTLSSRETVQVGKRPRDGLFGACFHPRLAGAAPVVYSARPGGRLWEASLQGGVVSTLRLRDLVSAPSGPIYGAGFTGAEAVTLQPSHSLSFSRLSILSNQYMVGCVDGAVFLFDPTHLKLVSWSCDVGRVCDWCCDGRQLFVLGDGVRVVSLVTPSECIRELVNFGYLEQTQVLLAAYSEHFGRLLPDSVQLYTAVNTAVEFAKSLRPTEDLPQNLQAMQAILDGLTEKFELSIPQKVSAPRVTTPTATTPTLATPTDQPYTGTVENGLMEIDLGSSEYNDIAQIDIDQFAPEAPEVNHLQLAESNDRGPSPLDLQDNIGFDECDSKGVSELDATLVPDEATELEKSTNSSTSLILDTQFITDQPQVDKDTEKAQISAFPESSGIEIPTRSHSIPGFSHSHSSEPDMGVSVGSSLDSGSKVANIEPKSLETPSASAEIQSNLTRNKSDLTQRVASALKQASVEDDVIAVPVVRAKGKKRSSARRTKKAPTSSPGRRYSSPDLPIPTDKSPSGTTTLPTLPTLPTSSLPTSLLIIPEEETLPFPEAGLPTPLSLSRQSTAPASLSSSPLTILTPSPHKSDAVYNTSGMTIEKSNGTLLNAQPSAGTSLEKEISVLEGGAESIVAAPAVGGSILGFQKPVKPAELLAKVKSLAKQRGVSMEPEALQGKMKMVKGLFQSLASTPGSYPPLGSRDIGIGSRDPHFGQRVFTNDEYSAVSDVPLDSDQAIVSDKPVVEVDPKVTAFLESTTATVAQLQEPSVFTSPSNTKQVLQGWLAKLHRLKTDLNSSSLHEPPIVNAHSISLVSLCFELEVTSASDDDPHKPSLAGFLRDHAPFLDHHRVSAALQSTEEWAVRRECWAGLVEAGRGHTTAAAAGLCSAEDIVARLREEEEEGGGNHTAALMASLLESSGDSFTQFCIKAFPAISPFEVAMTTGVDPAPQPAPPPSTRRCRYRLYAAYLSSLLGGPLRGEVCASLQQDPPLLLASLSALLLLLLGEEEEEEEEEGGAHRQALGTSEDGARVCGREVAVRRSDCLQVLLDLLVGVAPPVLEQAVAVCRQHCYWVGLVQLLVAVGDKKEALSLLVSLHDITLFTEYAGDLLTDLEDWKLLLMIMSGGVDRDVSSQHDHSQESSGSAVDTVSNNTRPVVARTVVKNLDFNSACVDTDAACVAVVSSVKAPPETSAGAANPPSADRVMGCPSDASIQRPSQCAVGSALQSERRAGEFSWRGLIELMLQHLSPTLTNQLLNEVAARKPLNEKLVQQLHSVLVQLTATHTEQRALAHALLEKVDRYLWSPRPTALGPQLMSVQAREREGGGEEEEEEEGRGLAAAASSFAPSCMASSLEDASTHWGVLPTSSAKCGCCKLSLVQTVSELHRGVLLFHCGHGFHSCCLPEQACVLCFSENVCETLVSHD